MKAIKSVGKFAGDEDVERWIDMFELAIEIDELKTKEAVLLSMHLTGLAYDTWKNLSGADKKDATAIKKALRSAFGMRRLDAWRAAQKKKLLIGDSIDALGEQISRCLSVSVAGGNTIEYVKGLTLLEALPTNIRDQVLLHLGEDLTYAKVLQTAKRICPQPATVEMSACGGADLKNRKPDPMQQRLPR